MRTSGLLLLSLALASVYVSSAPVEKPVEVSKRDQEMIMYGNQQNEPRMKKKKSDPAFSEVADDSNVDKQGYVEAVPANPDHIIQDTEDADTHLMDMAESVVPPIKQQVPENNEDSSEGVESPEPEADADSVEEELKGIMDASAQEQPAGVAQVEESPVVEEEVEQLPTKEVQEEVEEVEVPEESEEEMEGEAEEEAKEQEQEQAAVEEPAQEQEEEEMTDEVSDNTDIQRILDSLEYYYMKQRPHASRDEYYGLMYPSDFRYKRSTRKTRAVTEGGMARNDLQRSKRIKRDLFEDEDGIYYDPYGEETYSPEVSDDDLYGLYRVDPKYENEVATLLDMYEQAPEDEPYQAYEPYEQVPVEDIYPELYEELQEEAEEPEEPVYVPSKRQMLSSLPGIKKRYFYPFSREPQTHWGAFIPEQKRDYDQAYKRLLALASALSEESPYYQGYKK